MQRRMMKSLLTLSLSLGLLSQVHSAESESFKEAKLAFEKDNYKKSIVLLESAVGLDEKNAALWLLLAKSYYREGEITKAIKGFEKTIALAPNEQHAKSMLEKLTDNQGTVSQRFKLIRELVDQGHYRLAKSEAIQLKKVKLSDELEADWLFEMVRIFSGLNDRPNTILYIEKLKNNHPDFDQSEKMRLSIAWLNLSSKESKKIEQALSELSELSKHKDKIIAADAKLAVLHYRLEEGVNIKNTFELDQWFLAHPNHRESLKISLALTGYYKTLLQAVKPGQFIHDYEVRLFELSKHYLQKNVRAAERLTLSKDVLSFFKKRYSKQVPQLKLIELIDSFNLSIEDRDESFKLWGKEQLSLIRSWAKYKSAIDKNNGVFESDNKEYLTNKFLSLEIKLIKKGLLKETEAFSLLESHLLSISNQEDFDLYETHLKDLKQAVSPSVALEIDSEMIVRKLNQQTRELLVARSRGENIQSKLPEEVLTAYRAWNELFQNMSPTKQIEGMNFLKTNFKILFGAGLSKAVIDGITNIKPNDPSLNHFYRWMNCEFKASRASRTLETLQETKGLKELPSEVMAAINAYREFMETFGKGDSIQQATDAFVKLLTKSEDKQLNGLAAREYERLEKHLIELETNKAKELAANVAYYKERALFQSAMNQFNQDRLDRVKISFGNEIKKVFDSHEQYLLSYPHSDQRTSIANNFYAFAKAFLDAKLYEDASNIIQTLASKKIQPTLIDRDEYLSLLIKSSEVLNGSVDTEINALLQQKTLKQNALTNLNLNVAFTQQVSQVDKVRQQKIQHFKRSYISHKEKQRRDELFKQWIAEAQALINRNKDSKIAAKARQFILKLAENWTGYREWSRSIEIYRQYLVDNAEQLSSRSKVRTSISHALKQIALSSKGSSDWRERIKLINQAMDTLREEYVNMREDKNLNREVRWRSAWEHCYSYLEEARQVGRYKKSLSRSYFMRYANQLRLFAKQHSKNSYAKHIPSHMKALGDEIQGMGFYKEAIDVYRQCESRYPGHELSRQGGLQVARLYKDILKQPIKAAQVYLEMNHTYGDSIQLQNHIYEMSRELKHAKRWIESLHILEVFVASFPKHPKAGLSMEMIGEIHQANGAWEEAIASYKTVIEHSKSGPWIREARWAIADCYIQLSKWNEAYVSYGDYLKSYQKDSRIKELNRRLSILKDLKRFQALVDEEGQRKSYDAQYQIAVIVRDQLGLQKKAASEFMKVYTNWPKEHLADDALYQRGVSLFKDNNIEEARASWTLLAEKYQNSPLADDAYFLIGKSYEEESIRLGSVNREVVASLNKKRVQKEAYWSYNDNRRGNRAKQQSKLKEILAKGSKEDFDQLKSRNINQQGYFDNALVSNVLNWSTDKVEDYNASQLADQQDKINAALRLSVKAYHAASAMASSDKAGEALLKMAGIYDEKLKDSDKAMLVWKETVRQFSGTAVAENASWKIARYYEDKGNFKLAIEADKNFLRNYRRSEKAELAQFAIAEHFEQMNDWVSAMDAYSNYIKNYEKGLKITKAKEQINWIKTYRL